MKRIEITTVTNAFIFGVGTNLQDDPYYGFHLILGLIVIRINWKK